MQRSDLLLKVIHRLRTQGNTEVIIEHSLDAIKTTSWIVDLAPEGGDGDGDGDGDGQINATSTPDDVAQNPASFTGQYLAPMVRQRKSA
ncbi:MAG: hypothetical protein V4695_10105 [Pseudomonadota bacterium]